MKALKPAGIGVVILSLMFVSTTVDAGVFDNDEENWRRIFRDIKKINSRLVTLETGKMQALENAQRDLFRQIEEIKNLVPNLQGTVEQSQSEVTGHFQTTNRKLADIENQIKLDIVKTIDQQKIANERFQANLATQFAQLQSHMAGDMEKFANVNKEFFQGLAQSNSQSFNKVVERMKAQEQTLDRYKEVIKSDLIPTIVQQNEKTSSQLLQGMSKTSNELLAGMSKSNKENKDRLFNIELTNQKLLEVLQKSLKEGEMTRTNIELLSQNMKLTDENVGRTHENMVRLKDVLIQQVEAMSKAQENLAMQINSGSQKTGQLVEGVNRNLQVADEKINKLAESLKGMQTQSQASGASLASLQQNVVKIQADNALSGEKLNKLIGSSNQLATQSNGMSQSLQAMGQSMQNLEGGLAGVEASNQKLTKLIDILKAMAAEQGKLAQIVANQNEIRQSQGQILKAQGQINKNQDAMNPAQILKAQQDLKQAQDQLVKIQNQILQSQKQSLKDQAEAKKKLAELSRKANVNISRNDAIRKTLSNIGKTPPR
ncbi:MAG: hypothetical protein NPINA01_25400 [Nitrospinaceae bacterium]|nr:MAG: hypothetical protein NPINA01_25400 [Nitrospinaceae bacterium]